jgi:hypothetical protein
MASDRRRFLGRAGLSGVATVAGSCAWLPKLPRVSAREFPGDPALVPLEAGIEPLVAFLESTPRGDLMQQLVLRIEQGLSYRELLAALLLAGVRNVQPRPAVGFKFHSVLVVNSAHLASLASPDEDRWLPILWAVDYFKRTQREERESSGWRMQAVDESAVPAASRARQEFVAAMENWDTAAADAATAGLVRSAGRNELFELFCRFGARDFRSIGHKAIYVANSFRTLDCIGWQHAEPVMRSLAFALLNHTGEPKPSTSDLDADRPGRQNHEKVQAIREGWLDGVDDPARAWALIDALHQATPDAASDEAVSLLNSGASAQVVWDAVFCAAGELLSQQPGIIGLHALTTANALRYAFNTSGDDGMRRWLLLQACSFLPLFRQSAAERGKVASRRLNELLAEEALTDTPSVPVSEILVQVSRNRGQAAQAVAAYLKAGGAAEAFMDEARRMVFIKGNDAHDYKFSSAVLEDYYQVSRPLRPAFLASSVFNLCGAEDRDNALIIGLKHNLNS